MPSKIDPIQLPNSTALALYADRDPIAVEDIPGSHDTQGPNEAAAFTVRRESAFAKEHDPVTGEHRTVKVARAVVILWWDNYNDRYILDPESSVNEVALAQDPNLLQIYRVGAGQVEVHLPKDFGAYVIQDISQSERTDNAGGGYSLDWVQAEMTYWDGGMVVVERFTRGPWKDGDMAFALYAANP